MFRLFGLWSDIISNTADWICTKLRNFEKIINSFHFPFPKQKVLLTNIYIYFLCWIEAFNVGEVCWSCPFRKFPAHSLFYLHFFPLWNFSSVRSSHFLHHHFNNIDRTCTRVVLSKRFPSRKRFVIKENVVKFLFRPTVGASSSYTSGSNCWPKKEVTPLFLYYENFSWMIPFLCNYPAR